MASVRKSILFDEELANEIQKMADAYERDFSGQVRWIIREYLRIKQNQ